MLNQLEKVKDKKVLKISEEFEGNAILSLIEFLNLSIYFHYFSTLSILLSLFTSLRRGI
jgi:hypothetical protein